ncbi:MAG: thiol reductase thioredoxin [Phenylobacterium zucineum]|nr:MAG: thiol reductase thioredoxin [Phenylobacterium zucineum]
MKVAIAALFTVLAAASPGMAKPAPKVSIASFAQLKTPLPYPYDEKADADKAVAVAKAKARAQGKRLIVDLGGNWCPDCRILAATTELPELKAFVDRNFIVVSVDIGRFDKNLQVPAHYGITKRLEGVPALMVIDPKTDKLLNPAQISQLSDARHMTPQGLADWLAGWAP